MVEFAAWLAHGLARRLRLPQRARGAELALRLQKKLTEKAGGKQPWMCLTWAFESMTITLQPRQLVLISAITNNLSHTQAIQITTHYLVTS